MTDQSSMGQVSTGRGRGGGWSRSQVSSDEASESSVPPEPPPTERPANLPASTRPSPLIHTAPKPPSQRSPVCQVLETAQLLRPPSELGHANPILQMKNLR